MVGHYLINRCFVFPLGEKKEGGGQLFLTKPWTPVSWDPMTALIEDFRIKCKIVCSKYGIYDLALKQSLRLSPLPLSSLTGFKSHNSFSIRGPGPTSPGSI